MSSRMSRIRSVPSLPASGIAFAGVPDCCSVDWFNVGVSAEHDDPVDAGDHRVGELFVVLVGDIDADFQQRCGGQGR